MKLKPKIPSVIKPAGNQGRLFRCENCGTVFMGSRFILLPPRCPNCRSFKVKEDTRVSY
jgi:predicted Zn-ribbon and HTH transcriptional regulator